MTQEEIKAEAIKQIKDQPDLGLYYPVEAIVKAGRECFEQGVK